jgi:hypothetical protein
MNGMGQCFVYNSATCIIMFKTEKQFDLITKEYGYAQNNFLCSYLEIYKYL